MKIGYHEARLIVAEKVEKSLDKMLTQILIEVTEDKTLSLEDRMELVEAVPGIIGDLSQKLSWTIDYHSEELIKEKNKEKGDDN